MMIINEFLVTAHNKYMIYCDMDSVLTDFYGAIEKFGYGDAEQLFKDNEPLIWTIINKRGKNFWSKMEWMKDGKTLWEFIKPYHPTILSAPSKTKGCMEGKNEWVHRELGPHVKVILSKAMDKHIYAGKHNILIDDMENNCADWTKAGGIAILHKNSKWTIEKLKEILDA